MSPEFHSAPDAAEIARRQVALQRQVTLLGFVLLVLAGSVFIFLFRQVQLARRQADGLQNAGEQVLARYRTNLEPRALMLERDLRELARTRPELAQLMARFADSDATNAPPR
jgi:hypothetical protein